MPRPSTSQYSESIACNKRKKKVIILHALPADRPAICYYHRAHIRSHGRGGEEQQVRRFYADINIV